jgi:hypothetical protein
LKEWDVLDTTEKVGKPLKAQNVPEAQQTADKTPKSRKQLSKKQRKEAEEEEEEQAVLHALQTVPGCQKLLSKLSETAEESFVVSDSDAESGSEEDEEEEEMETTDASYKGNEIRIFGEDSEIELKTPPGMKKRNMKSGGEDVEEESDYDLELSDSGDEGFEETVAAKKTPKKTTPKPTPKKEKKTPLKIFTSAAGSTGKKKRKSELGLTRREELRRANNKKRHSAPAGDALVSKKFKNTAFLDRSLNRKRVSKRADEIDSD